MGSDSERAGLTLRKINVKEKPAAVSAMAAEESAGVVEEEEPVTPAGRLFMEPDMNCYILCTLAFEQPIDVTEFKRTLLGTLVKHKRFHSVIRKNKKGKDVWVPVSVDINAHIIELVVDMSTPRFLEDYVTDLALAPPLDITRPMWNCHIINGKGDKIEGAIAYMIVRVHHALGDGTSLMSLLLACTRRLGHPNELPTVPIVRPRKLVRKSLLHQVLAFFIFLWNTFVGIFLFTSTALWLKDSDSIIKGYFGVEKEKKKLVIQIANMADFAIVKNAVNGTVNDVLMAVVGEGLLHYLEGRYATSTPANSEGKVETTSATTTTTTTNETRAATMKSKKVLSKVENMRIRACALMNTRGSPGLQELASMMDGGSQHRWGNHMGYLIMNIPLKNQLDPLDYVRTAKKANDRKKNSMEGIFTYMSGAVLMNLTGPIEDLYFLDETLCLLDGILSLVDRLLGGRLMKPPCILTRRVCLQTTLAISNVPGPTEAVTLGGNPIVGIYPIAFGHPQALSIYLASYDGKASLVIMSAESAIPDPEVLGQLCIDSLQAMVRAAKAQVSS